MATVGLAITLHVDTQVSVSLACGGASCAYGSSPELRYFSCKEWRSPTFKLRGWLKYC